MQLMNPGAWKYMYFFAIDKSQITHNFGDNLSLCMVVYHILCLKVVYFTTFDWLKSLTKTSTNDRCLLIMLTCLNNCIPVHDPGLTPTFPFFHVTNSCHFSITFFILKFIDTISSYICNKVSPSLLMYVFSINVLILVVFKSDQTTVVTVYERDI